jgi:Leucine-rich repeat (LRR) protein
MNLVDDVINYILTLLDFKTLVRLSGVNKQFKQFCKNESLWLTHFNKTIYKKCDMTYYQSFKSLKILDDFFSKYEISYFIFHMARNNMIYLCHQGCTLKSLMYKLSTFSLTHLSLPNCGLNCFPYVDTFTSLNTLNLTNNQFNNIPSDLFNLTQLHVLKLGQNNLTHLPLSLTQLTSLHSLYVNNNQIKIIPEKLLKLPSLNIFYYFNNPLISRPLNKRYERVNL